MQKKHWRDLGFFVAGGFLFAPLWGFVRGLARKA